MRFPQLVAIATLLLLPLRLGAQAPVQKQVPTLAERLKAAEDRIELLEGQLFDLQRRTRTPFYFFNCDDKNYFEIQPTNSKFGFIAFCEKVEPYLEGFRVTLSLTTPHAVVFHGLKGKLGHGETPLAAYRKQEDFSVADAITSGEWTSAVVTINPAAARDVRNLRLEFEVGSMSLRK